MSPYAALLLAEEAHFRRKGSQYNGRALVRVLALHAAIVLRRSHTEGVLGFLAGVWLLLGTVIVLSWYMQRENERERLREKEKERVCKALILKGQRGCGAGQSLSTDYSVRGISFCVAEKSFVRIFLGLEGSISPPTAFFSVNC